MFKNWFALMVLKLAFKVLPDGYTIKMWKWDNGQGNFQVFACPNDGRYSITDILYSLHK